MLSIIHSDAWKRFACQDSELPLWFKICENFRVILKKCETFEFEYSQQYQKYDHFSQVFCESTILQFYYVRQQGYFREIEKPTH